MQRARERAGLQPIFVGRSVPKPRPNRFDRQAICRVACEKSAGKSKRALEKRRRLLVALSLQNVVRVHGRRMGSGKALVKALGEASEK